MKLSKHYAFNIMDEINVLYVTIYGSNRVGIWKGDGEVEFRIEMTFDQGEEVAHQLLSLIAARRKKDAPKAVCGHYDENGNFVEDTNEDNL